MTKVRVHELARELNVESKVLMTRLKSAGVKVASHQSTLTDEQVAEMRQAFGGGSAATTAGTGAAASAAAPATDAGGRPRVILRRRAPSAEAADADSGSTATAAVEAEAPQAAEMPAPKAPVTPQVQAQDLTPHVEPAQHQEPQVSPAPQSAAPVETQPAEAERKPAPVTPVETPRPVAAEARPAEAAAKPRAPEPEAPAPVRRREVLGGATIVRRATPEEIANMERERNQRSPMAGRREDARGTRITGMGLLSNRVSSPEPGAVPTSEEDDRHARRPLKERGRAGGSTAAEEEEARAKKIAKAKRTAGSLNMRSLLAEVDEIEGGAGLEAEVAPVAPVVDEAAVARTVYTPTAQRNRRDLKRRKDLKKTQITVPRAAYRVVEMGETITVGELGRQLSVKASDIIKKLMSQGVMATINQPLDHETAVLIAGEYKFEVKSVVTTDSDILASQTDDEGTFDKITRPPIVTVMGHVDHGKTSILDAIRQTDVVAGEAGGITQHIGAYSVVHNGRQITFLDTPGHEAFSAMRARGAKVTDIVVLVVAADDGVMPQTVEAINHAKAAGVPIVVAVNKIDKPNTNLDRVYTELTEHGIQAEEWGGETQFVKTSAVKRTGINELLEAILLQTEVLELQARHEGLAEGAVIEAHLDKGRGPVATIVVQKGTLKPGEYVVAGTQYGRVRAMQDHRGRNVLAAGPSDAVEIQGLGGVPMAGDQVNGVVDERTAREVSAWRETQARQSAAAKSSAASLEDLLNKVKSAEVPEVALIIKGDTQGSVEAISESILKLSTPKVKNRIVHAAVGGITESDITLAEATGAIIFGFHVRAVRGLDEVADRHGVLIKYFNIIYEIVDAVKAIMVGKLPPIVNEVITGHAEVRKAINVPKIGVIAGSAVIDGKIARNAQCRLIRDNIVIYSGKLGSLRRFKDDVKEVVQGYECGIGIDGYADIREGDVVEAFVLEETAATL